MLRPYYVVLLYITICYLFIMYILVRTLLVKCDLSGGRICALKMGHFYGIYDLFRHHITLENPEYQENNILK